MTIKISDSIKGYQNKLFHPSKTINIGFAALRRLKPPMSVSFKRIDCVDRLNIPVYQCKTDTQAKRIYPANRIFSHKGCGKGASLIQSKASAFMELLERFSCYSFLKNDDNFLVTSCSRMKQGLVLNNLYLSLQKKFRTDRFIRNEIAVAPLKWAKSFSLTKKEDSIFPLDWFSKTTNGFAAGNCIEEAIMQGIGECIERGVVARIVEKRLVTPSVDADSIDCIQARKIISRFNRCGITLFIKDFSCGFDIPTIGILAYDPKGSKPVKIYCAAGTSLNRDVALIRALTEIAQHRTQALFENHIRSNSFGFPFYRDLKTAYDFIKCGTVIRFSDLPTFSNANFKVEIETATRKLRDKGHEILVTNAMHPVLQIPAVIVTIPGLQIPHMQINPYLTLIDSYMKAHNYSKANKLLHRYFKSYPSESMSKELLFIYGYQYEKLNKFERAIKTYERLLVLLGPVDKEALIKAFKALLRCRAYLKKRTIAVC